MPRRNKMSNILDLMYVSLINIIITSISTQLPGFVAWIRRQYNIVINFLLDKIYGDQIEIIISTFSCVNDQWHSMAYVLMNHISAKYNIKNNSYIHKDNIESTSMINDIKNIGNHKIGIKLISLNASTNVKNPLYHNKAVFYSRIHTKEQINDLYMDLYDKHCKLEKKTKIAVHVPDGENSSGLHSRGNMGIESHIYDLYEGDKKIYQKEHYDNIVQVLKMHDHANFMLYGPPGTGKTNLINKVANDFEAVLIVANLKDFKNIHDLRKFLSAKTFEQVGAYGQFCKVQPNIKFYLFEDFTTMLPASFWKAMSDKIEDKKENNIEIISDILTKTTDKTIVKSFDRYTFSDLLNLLDGVIKLKNSYCFFTTNHIDAVDSALYRDGRMFLMNISLLNSDTINKFIADNFSNESNANQTWNPMPIAKLYAYKILYPEKKRFVEELEKYNKTLINQ